MIDDRSRRRDLGQSGRDDHRGRRHRAASDYGDPGPHRGRGPRGYQRSDDRIRDDVYDRLTHDFFVDATDIEADVADGEVTLNGMVNNRGERRRAEEIVEDVFCVRHVQNNLRVNPEGADVKD